MRLIVIYFFIILSWVIPGFAKTDRQIREDLEKGHFYEFEEFDTLSYEQKLKYVLFLGHFQAILAMVRVDEEIGGAEGFESAESSFDQNEQTLQKLNSLFELIFHNAYGFQFVPLAKPPAVLSTSSKAVSTVVEAGDWIEGEFTRVIEPIKKTGLKFGSIVTKLAKGVNVAELLLYSSDLNENELEDPNYIAMNEALKKKQNINKKNGVVPKEVDSKGLLQSDLKSRDRRVESSRKSAATENLGAKRRVASTSSEGQEHESEKSKMCLFGGWVSTYSQINKIDSRRHCLPPKGKINSKKCPRRRFGNPTFECNNFGLSQSFDEEVLGPKMCVPLYVEGKIGDLTLRCTKGLSEMMQSTVRAVNPQAYNESVNNVKSMWDEFKGATNKDMTVKQYCDSDNRVNGKRQQSECKAIAEMMAAFEASDRYQVQDSTDITGQTK